MMREERIDSFTVMRGTRDDSMKDESGTLDRKSFREANIRRTRRSSTNRFPRAPCMLPSATN